MAIQTSLKRNYWKTHTGPWFWPIVSCGASSIFTWVLADTASAACPCATRQSGNDIHDFCCCYLWCWWPLFSEHCIRPRIVFHNITSEYNSTFVFLVLCLQFSIFQMTYVHRWGEVNFCALRPCFIDHLFLTSDFHQVPRRNFLQFFPFLVHCCFCCGNFHSLRHGNEFVNRIVMLQWIVTSSCNMVFVVVRWGSPMRSLVDSLASKIHASFDLFLLDLWPFPQFWLFMLILQGIAGATGVSNFLREFLMVSLNSLSTGSMK